MAKRVDIGVPRIWVNETDCRVLRAVAERAFKETGLRFSPVAVSQRELSVCIGIQVQSIRMACGRLVSRGLMIVTPRYDRSGGRLSNNYELTAMGLEVLRLAEARGAFDPEGDGDEYKLREGIFCKK